MSVPTRLLPVLLALPLLRAVSAAPAAAPIPVPPAAPAPITLSTNDLEWVRHEIYVRESERMDQELPRTKKDDELRLRLINGADLVGSFVFASSNTFTAVRNNVESRQSFRDLDHQDRLRLDPTFREAALKLASLAQAQALMPPLKTPPPPRSGLTWEELLRSGTADERLAFARSILATWSERSPGPLDPGYAFLLSVSALPVNTDAAALAGLMLLNGQGVRKNPELSLQLLAASAAGKSNEASSVLAKFKVDNSRRVQAQADGERWLAARREELRRHEPRVMALKKEREEARLATLGPEPAPPPPPEPPKKKRR